MASMINILSLFFVFSLFIQGSFQQPCQNSDIVVIQKPTGKAIHGKPEYNVTITNKCLCTVKNLELNCNGFQTTLPVLPKLLAVSGDTCLVNNGDPLYSSGPFKEPIIFSYAWDVPFRFTPKSLQFGCS